MFMITDSEFVAEMVRKIAIRYKSKRQFALEIGEKTGQNLNHWIKRGRVPGDKKPLVAEKLSIDWLDNNSRINEQLNNLDQSSFADNCDIVSNPNNKVPLLSIESASNLDKHHKNNSPRKGEFMISCSTDHSYNAFALKISGDSMTTSSGMSFPDGMTIIIDPEQIPISGDFALALVEGTNIATFKQLVIDGDKHYLKPLNHQYPLITDKFKIIGKAIEAFIVL
ncbi:MAG: hypothetical protein HOM14_03545 [Gammaproteobacteria bacterium]|nr:hypothetical protein [Gammaproteobacteria bacterium]